MKVTTHAPQGYFAPLPAWAESLHEGVQEAPPDAITPEQLSRKGLSYARAADILLGKFRRGELDRVRVKRGGAYAFAYFPPKDGKKAR